MSPEEVWLRQLTLEGLGIDREGYVERWKDMPGESGPPSKVLAVDFGRDCAVYFGSHIHADAERLLRGIPSRSVFAGTPEILAILGGDACPPERAEYWTYTVSGASVVPASSRVVRLGTDDELLRVLPSGFFGALYEDVFAAFVNGSVVAGATSSREDDAAAELWVFTLPDHRRRGHAARCSAAWLRSAIDRGITPLYSHRKENEPSRRLAESLGLRRCFALASFS